MFQLIRDLFLHRKLKQASREENPGDRCVACDSTDVTVLAPQTYRCNQCDHEGGDGYAAWKHQQRDAALRALPPRQRRESASRDLQQARSLLLSAVGSLEGARTLSVLDIVGVGGMAYGGTSGEGMEKQQLFTSAARPVTEARTLIMDARVKLGGNREPQAGDTVDEDYALWSVDLYFDNLLIDVLQHARIEDACAQAQHLIGLVEEVLRRELNWSPPS